MNAQESWKYQYRLYKSFRALSNEFEWNREDMKRYRREAALERTLEASQREVKRLQEWIDYENIVYPDE